jgi:hypothetical protein
MELEISVEKRDQNLEKDLLETAQPRVGEKKIIVEGVSIRIKNYFGRDTIDLSTILNIVADIGEKVALPIAVGVLSRYLYDKLKDRKESKVTINHIPVEINARKIEQLIINIARAQLDFRVRETSPFILGSNPSFHKS